MSLSYLPLPIYIVLVLGSITIAFLCIKKDFYKLPKTFTLGLILSSVGALFGISYKLIKEMSISSGYLWVFILTSSICCILGLMLMLIGSYNNVKNDEKAKRTVFLLIICIFILLIIGVLIFLNIYYNK